MAKMTNCKSCGKEIATSAKTCPHCGAKNKKPFYKAVWFWVLVAIIVIAIAIGGSGGNDSSSDNGSASNSKTGGGNTSETKVIEYQKVDVDELEDALESNAAAAKDTYNKKNLEITGKLGTIDSDLKYFSLMSNTDEFDILGITCYIKNQETKDMLKSLSKDQTIVVKGKITDVGEVLGYSLDIDEIIPQ